MSVTDDVNGAEVRIGREAARKRRRWSLAEKLTVIAESNGKATNMSAVARRHGITPSQLYRWRKSFSAEGRQTSTKDYTLLTEVVARSTSNRDPGSPYIEIQLMDGRRLIFSPTVNVDIIANLIKAIES